MNPTITIVMPVYQAADTIAAALDSIIHQSYNDWELLVMDDGCTDNTLNIVQSYNDSRIRIISCEHNFIATLNRGFLEAKGTYVARMDADDLMHLDRLKVQHSLMERHPDIDILGSWVEVFGEESRSQVIGSLYGYIKDPLFKLLHGNILFHPTVMIRKTFWDRHQLQYETFPHAEDYKLWVDAAMRGAVIYIESQPLIYYRVSQNQITQKYRFDQQESTLDIRELVAEELIRRDESCDALQTLWNANRLMIDRKRLSQEYALSFISSILERRSNSVE